MPKSFATLDQVDVAGKKVLVRVDLNVPMRDGRVTDDLRISRILPTLHELARKGARVAVLSHFGRPDGKRVADMSLQPVAQVLATALGQPVAFADDCVGATAEQAVAALKPGGMVVLENTRFHPGEEKNDPDLARRMAVLGDIYVNDAFSCAHRAHVTTEALAHLLPAYAGRNMEVELKHLNAGLEAPEHPVAAVVGGANVSTKLELLGNLLGSSRLLFALGRDGYLPSAWARVSARHHVPLLALATHAAVALTLAIVGSFETLVLISGGAVCLVYVMVCVAAWRAQKIDLRERGAPFVLKGGPLVPLVAVVGMLAILATLTQREWLAIGVAVAVLAVVYAVLVGLRRRVGA